MFLAIPAPTTTVVAAVGSLTLTRLHTNPLAT